MKYSGFVTGETLPDLCDAFASAVNSAPAVNNTDELTVSVIGEPGVGKSYIATKLSEGLLGEDMHTIKQQVSRDDMHDLILWSVHTNGAQENIQYDQASLRFVDQDYHDFVMAEHEKTPIPPRMFPGVTFVEHPTAETENKSDMVVRLSFSDIQKDLAAQVMKKMEQPNADLTVLKQDLADIAAVGCHIEIETRNPFFDTTKLATFFEDDDDMGYIPAQPSELDHV